MIHFSILPFPKLPVWPLVDTPRTCSFASGMPTACRPLALLLHLAAAGAFGGVQEAKEFVKVELPNAKCLDGSPAVYYIAANASSTAWLVYARTDAPTPPPRPTPSPRPPGERPCASRAREHHARVLTRALAYALAMPTSHARKLAQLAIALTRTRTRTRTLTQLARGRRHLLKPDRLRAAREGPARLVVLVQRLDRRT